MSNENKKPKVLAQPHQTIGAQDLLQVGASHSGFLRKRGRLERVVESFVLLKPILRRAAKWRQRFVVISAGCVYVFADEFSRRPFQRYSLNGYTRISRLQNVPSGIQWAFALSPDETYSGRKTYTFACPSDNDRMEWMTFFKTEMHLANDVPLPSSGSLDQGDYVGLEKPVPYSKPQPVTDMDPNGDRARCPTPSDDDSDYDKPEEYDDMKKEEVTPNGRARRSKPNVPLPDIPVEAVKATPRPPVTPGKKPPPGGINVMMTGSAPTPSSPTSTLNREHSREEFEYQGPNRDDAIRLLSHKPEGTFLVRPSRQDDRQVLCVLTSEGVKEYKIYKQNWSQSLDNKTFFPTLEALVTNYETCTLPNRTLSLGRGYNSPFLS